MEYEISFSPDQAYMIIHVNAKHTPDLFKSYLKAALEHPGRRSHMNSLIDLRSANLSELGIGEINENIEIIKIAARKIGSGRCAVLLSEATGGFLQMAFWLMGCQGNLPFAIKIFTEEHEAHNWLLA
jgi:hypothetical protein